MNKVNDLSYSIIVDALAQYREKADSLLAKRIDEAKAQLRATVMHEEVEEVK